MTFTRFTKINSSKQTIKSLTLGNFTSDTTVEIHAVTRHSPSRCVSVPDFTSFLHSKTFYDA